MLASVGCIAWTFLPHFLEAGKLHGPWQGAEILAKSVALA